MIKLDFYTVRLHVKREQDNYVKFDEIFEEGSFTDFFQTFIESFNARYTNKRTKSTFQIDGGSVKLASERRVISGLVKAGSYGQASDVANVLTGEEGQISNDDSIINPYYFLLYIPENSTVGCLILQRKGVHGMSTDFRTYLKTFIVSKLKDYVFEMNYYSNMKILLELIDRSSVDQIILKKYDVSSDKWDRYRGFQESNDQLQAKFILSAKSRFGDYTKEKVESFIRDPKGSFFEIKELRTLGFDGNVETSVRLNDSGKDKIVILNDADRFRLSFDVTDDVAIDSNNHPSFNSLDKIAKELMEEHFYVV